MTAIPAKVAGVKTVIMVSPPKNITPAVLYAASVAGVDRIFRVGGPAAIGALAVGTKSIPKVDMIVGPGNAYVNEAKRQVFGQVGIDSLAGPSEVAIIADANAPIDYIVNDVRAQLEHDERATATVFSLSARLTAALRKEFHAADRLSLSTVTLKQAIALVNALAPEHLELLVANPTPIIAQVHNAGAIFSGYATPTAVGDYWAGPSHALPTAGTARFASGLSVATFMKRTSLISYTQEHTKRIANDIVEIATAEGMAYHAASVTVRKRK
jgi:histidinol dehydrogenase